MSHKVDFYVEYPITRRGRYTGIKGKYWDFFAYYVCLRDYKTYGTCITCGQKKEFSELQAGHFAPAGNCGFALLFDERNVHGECPYDNSYNRGHLIQYKTNLTRRYSNEYVSELEEKYNDSRYRGKTTKEWSKKEYEAKIEEIKSKIKDLCLT